MTIEYLCIALRKQFPNALGLSVAGSQKNNQIFNNVSDIDVLIFDVFPADVYSQAYKIDECHIDAVFIPLLDLENTILNEYADVRQTVHNMIKESSILYDPIGIIAEIKSTLINSRLPVNLKVKTKTEYLEESLLKMRKYFNRQLSEDEKTILLCEFVTIASTLEVLKKTKMEAVRLRKAKLLKEHSPLVTMDIMKLFKEITTTGKIDLLYSYINEYLKHSDQVKEYFSTQTIIDVEVKDLNHEKIYLELQSHLNANVHLKDIYQYHCFSQIKYHRLFKHSISIFYKSTRELTDEEIMRQTKEMLINAYGNNISVNLVPLANKFKNEILDEWIQNLRTELCKLTITLSVKNTIPTLEKESVIIDLCAYTQNLLEMDMEDCLLLNNVLMQRWSLSKEEQRTTFKRSSLQQLISSKQMVWDKEFQTNKATLLFLNNKNSKDFISQISIESKRVIKMMVNDASSWSTYYLPESILAHLKVKQLKSAKKYLTVLEEIFLMTNLSDENKARCLYFFSKTVINNVFDS